MWKGFSLHPSLSLLLGLVSLLPLTPLRLHLFPSVLLIPLFLSSSFLSFSLSLSLSYICPSPSLFLYPSLSVPLFLSSSFLCPSPSLYLCLTSVHLPPSLYPPLALSLFLSFYPPPFLSVPLYLLWQIHNAGCMVAHRASEPWGNREELCHQHSG